jgi:hypothetical protein
MIVRIALPTNRTTVLKAALGISVDDGIGPEPEGV